MAQLSKHRNFKWLLHDIKFRLQRAVLKRLEDAPTEPPNVTVGIYCKGGKHRSVAMAEFLKHIGKTLEGFETVRLTHLSAPRWGRGTCRGYCEECRRDADGEREKAMQVAVDFW